MAKKKKSGFRRMSKKASKILAKYVSKARVLKADTAAKFKKRTGKAAPKGYGKTKFGPKRKELVPIPVLESRAKSLKRNTRAADVYRKILG